jgi:hypothetical protein
MDFYGFYQKTKNSTKYYNNSKNNTGFNERIITNVSGRLA